MKKFDMGIVIAIIGQTVGIVWWAATVQANNTQNNVALAELKERVEATQAVVIPREQLNDILKVRDDQISGVKNDISELRMEVRQGFQAIQLKLK